MHTLELILLLVTYSTLIIALFLEVICYRKNMESLETIGLTLSLLLLIISLSINAFFSEQDSTMTDRLTLVSMQLVALMTPLNILVERKFTIPSWAKTLHHVLSGLVIVAVLLGMGTSWAEIIEWAVVIYLMVSVACSMLIIQFKDPQKKYAHLKKNERYLAIAFILLIPLYLILNYGFPNEMASLQIGFIIPLLFMLMAVNKIFDDLQRLSMIKSKIEPQQQKFKNYALTSREAEIAELILQGMTYQDISDRLFISMPTVKTHVSKVYKKCGVKTRHELVALLMS